VILSSLDFLTYLAAGNNKNNGGSQELATENKRLSKKISMLQDEIATKEAIIKTLDSSPSNK
jgi:hypothetical protein